MQHVATQSVHAAGILSASRRESALLGFKDRQGLLTHERAQVDGFHEVSSLDIEEPGIGCVLGCASWQALGNTNARAVELANDPLVHRARSARLAWIGIDEIRSPPERQWLSFETKVLHERWNVLVQEVLQRVESSGASGL